MTAWKKRFNGSGSIALAAALTDAAGGSVAVGLLILAARHYRLDWTALGLVGALGPLVYIAATYPFGLMSDAWKRKPLIVGGASLAVLSSVGYALSSRVSHLPWAIAAGSIGMGMFWPSVQATLAEGNHSLRLSRTLGPFNMAWCTGHMIGVFLAGRFYERGWREPFYFGAALYAVVALLFLARRMPPVRVRERRTVRPTEIRPRLGWLAVARAANFTNYFALGAMMVLFPKLANSYAMSAAMTSRIMSSLWFAVVITFLVLLLSRGWQYRLEPLLVMQVLAVMGLLLMVKASSEWGFAAAFILVGFATGISYYSSQFYGLDGQSDMGRKSGGHEATLAAGVLFGPLAGGWLAGATGSPRAPYWLCLVIVLVVLAAFAAVGGRLKRIRQAGVTAA